MERWDRQLKGWVFGCGAATAVIILAILFVFAAASLSQDSHTTRTVAEGVLVLGGQVYFVLIFSPVIFLVTCLLTGIPAAILVWLSRKFQISEIAYFACAGAALGAASVELLVRSLGSPPSSGYTVQSLYDLVFALAGLAAGLVYWFVAVRHMPPPIAVCGPN